MDDSYWLAFKEKNKDNWHFDPSQKSQDFTYIGKLKTNFTPLLALMKDDKNFTEYIMVQDIKKHTSELSEEAVLRASNTVKAVSRGDTKNFVDGPFKTNQNFYGDENPLSNLPFEQKVKLLEKGTQIYLFKIDLNNDEVIN